MMVHKRDGRTVPFEREKIVQAVLKAFNDVDGEITPEARRKAVDIAASIESLNKDFEVEEIQDLVEDKLMASKRKDVARTYIIYRNHRSLDRERNSKFMKIIGEKLMASNVQNQNANVDEHSFGGRKGEANSELMRKYALDYMMSDLAKERHLNNEIYTHDLDSYSVGQHNCYDSSTKFITKNGVKRFGDCADGQSVEIVDMYGNWRKAIVHKYGKQKMYDLTFTSSLTTKKVTCTRNHRWVLEDGNVTDNISIGDKLFLTPELNNEYVKNDQLWCFGFVLGDGSDFYIKSKDRSRITNSGMVVRLCGHKIQYINKFISCGWTIRQTHKNGDVDLTTRGNGAFKQAFLNNEMWKIMSHNDLCNIVDGYLHADGHICNNGVISISTSDVRLVQMIEDTTSVLGYYVWSKRKKYNDTNFKENRTLYEFHLIQKQSTKWILTNIVVNRDSDNGHKIAWCVEEPVTHTFTLDGGMVTGNCLSVPFDKLLANGFNTRQTDVRPAQSVNTAFQLVAVIFQLQSLQQFGGVSATHLDWTMVPYIRKSFRKHYLDGMIYCITPHDAEWQSTYNVIVDSKNNELSVEDSLYKKYQNAYVYANDMTNKETYQAVQGMYHNLNTLQSRSGNQLPFTSINYGTCTLPEGRLVIKALLDCSIEGVGKLHKTPIFPCGIFQCARGINREPGDPNYDLFKLALKSTSQRLYPNYANVDWSGNAGYDKNDPKTYFSTMGLDNVLSSYKTF